MENRNNTTVVLGSLRYKSAIDTDISLNPSLTQKEKKLLETNRNSAINLNQIFDNERQQSTNFRFTFNVKFLYENDLIGQIGTSGGYAPFLNNLYYVNNIYNAISYSGYPQNYEFDLIRNDYNNSHINFIAKSATTYNWNYFLTYGFKNDQTTTLNYIDTTNDITWIIGDGIPVFISRAQVNGTNVIQFRSFVKHGLNDGEFVMLNGFSNVDEFVFPSSSGTNVYEIYSFGNGEYSSEEYVFNVIDVGYPNILFNNQIALFKRVLNPNNLTETTSKYYVRKNKILTNLNDLILTYNGYQNSPFKDDKKYEFSALTPNRVNRISIRNTNKTYNITNSIDLNITGLTDNNGKPVSEIFLTFLHKGFMGWFNYPNTSLPPQTQITPPALKKGWYFNITNNIVNNWWNDTNTLSDTDIPTQWYTTDNTNYFFYNQTLNINDIIDGDVCEYNDFEQKERVISEHYHKIKYNKNLFTVNLNNLLDNNNLPGFYYQTHFPCKIRAFSPYIETGTNNSSTYFESLANYSGYTSVDIPPYSFYSAFNQEWRWRDIYTYGYIDTDGIGVDFPFLNKTHYPYSSVFFRLIPDEANYLGYSNVIIGPIIDDCE